MPIEELQAGLLEAVKRAGAIMRTYTGQRVAVAYKSSFSDLVTVVDRQVEQEVRQILMQRFPDHGMVGEEDGGGWDRPYTWVLDPVDGTTNFAHGLPNFVCALACYRGQEPIVAAVYDPSREELFLAAAGRGATCNGLPIQVDPAERLQESLVATNLIWSLREDRYVRLPQIQRIGQHVRGIRSLGAAALEMAYVACGRMTGFFQEGLGPWDFGAAALLVTEAGGRVTQLDGSPLDITRACSVAATNGRIHEELLALLHP
jgi:myo-inositol-1(or 4)-monophosphatase